MSISDGLHRIRFGSLESPYLRQAELNGESVHAGDLAIWAMLNYGHFTSMQVSDQRVRGLDLHLKRLNDATHELFACALDTDEVRRCMRHIIGDRAGTLSLRITVFSRGMRRDRPAEPAKTDLLITTDEPRAAATTPLRLKSFRYERVPPHIKHVGTFGLFHHRRLAQLEGFDDALFVDANDAVCEASVWNIGFFDGSRIVWPNAPALTGISMQLLNEGLSLRTIETASLSIARADLGRYRSAFLTNSSCPVRPIAAIDNVDLVVDRDLTQLLEECYAASPWQVI